MTAAPALQPPIADFLADDSDATHVAVALAVRVDLASPIAIFMALGGDAEGSFLLESVEGGELMGRYTFMGFGVRDAIEWHDGVCAVRRDGELHRFETGDPLAVVEAELRRFRVRPAPNVPRFQGGAVGWIGFDCVSAFEPVPRPEARGLGLPAMRMLLPQDLVVYDHLKHTLTFVTHAALAGDRGRTYAAAVARLETMAAALGSRPLPAEPPWPVEPVRVAPVDSASNWPAGGYCAAVARAKEAIAAGEVFQVVLSQRFSIAESLDPLTLYRSLRALNPSPYMFLLRFADCCVVGSSPEVLVRLDGDDVLVRPIAGTRRRGATEAEDAALEAELLADEKELAEHRMLVDLGRNDVGRVAAVGTVELQAPLHIERYSHVMHIVSDVHGKLAPGKTAFDVFRACFPAGTVSGAPKVRACELIATIEPDRRGVYAGAVGYFDFAGNMDTCIAIRTMVVTADAVHVQAGAGIVYDSVPALEDEECRNKARAAFAAIALARSRCTALAAAPTSGSAPTPATEG